MKSTKAFLASLLFAGVLALGAACSDDDDGDSNGTTLSPADESTPALPTEPPENDEPNDREDFVTTVEAQMEQLQTQIDELASEVGSMSGDDQAAAQERLDGLKDEKADIEHQLQEAESASDGDFERIKTEIEAKVEGAMTEAQEFADEIGI